MERLGALKTLSSGLARGALTLIALAIGRAVVGHIPMLQELWITDISMSGCDIVDVIISLLMIGVLLRLGHVLRHSLPELTPGFPESGLLVSSIIQLIVIVVAYHTLQPFATLFLKQQDMWVYRLVFLLLACYPIWQATRVTLRGIDKTTAWLTARIAIASGEAIECPRCGALNKPSAKFCARCGASLAEAGESSGEYVACPHCETRNPPGARYCTNCGEPLPRS